MLNLSKRGSNVEPKEGEVHQGVHKTTQRSALFLSFETIVQVLFCWYKLSVNKRLLDHMDRVTQVATEIYLHYRSIGRRRMCVSQGTYQVLD